MRQRRAKYNVLHFLQYATAILGILIALEALAKILFKFVPGWMFIGLSSTSQEVMYFVAGILLALLAITASNEIGHIKDRICLAATNTIEYNETLTAKVRLAATKKGKGGTWYSDHWQPYCVTSSGVKCSMPRMAQRSYGFECLDCGNMIGFNLQRLEESPLNNKK